jgi:transcriptional regulator with XRE-family HTH domain
MISTDTTIPTTTMILEEARAFGTRLAQNTKSAIKSAGKSQREIATVAGISRSTLSRRLTGKSSFFLNELIDIGGFIGVDANALLRAAEDGAYVA